MSLLRDGDSTAAAQLRSGFRKVSRHAWILILTALIAGAAAAFFTGQQRATYWSEAKVLVKSPNIAPSTTGGIYVNMATEAEIAQSAAVAEVAVDHLDHNSRRAPGGVSVQNPSGTDILAFRYTSTSRAAAIEGAQAYAEAYLEFRREKAAEELVTILRLVNERIADAREELRAVNDRIAIAETDSDRLTLEAQASAHGQEIQGLRQQLASYSAPDALQAGYVVEDAVAAGTNAPPLRRNVLAAVALGLGFGAAIALFRERFDDRIRTVADLITSTGLEVLAPIPPVGGLGRGASRALPSLMQPTSGVAEAYRHLAANISFRAQRSGLQTILVTSAEAGEGKSMISANLGVSLAKSHRNVVLVCADMRNPTLHNLFYAENQVGLSTVLHSDNGWIDGLVRTGIDNLRLLPSGPPVDDPSQLLSSERVTFLLDKLRSEADLVIFDCPPVLPVADAILLGPRMDGVILVADAGRTRAEEIRAARARLEQVGANILGGVLNRSREGAASAYGKYPVVERTQHVHPALAQIVDLDRRDSK